MSSTYLIPLSNIPQTFTIALAGKDYDLTCKWNDAFEGGWVLDFTDTITAAPIVSNVPLITGIDILEGLQYLGFQGQLFIFTDGDQFAVPTIDNLGTESNLYFVTDVADGG